MRNRCILFLLLVVAVGIGWFLWARYTVKTTSPSSTTTYASRKDSDRSSTTSNPAEIEEVQSAFTPSAPPVGVKKADSESEQGDLNIIAPTFRRSLVFHGRVVDERNAPIAGAKVRFSVMNNPNPNGSNTRGEMESNQNGLFEIRGRGMGIYVEVSKQGYYQMPDSDGRRGSSGGFRNYENLSSGEVPMPLESQPAIFVLHKIGDAKPLIHAGPRSIIVPKDGTPIDIDLMTGRAVAAGMGQLRVEAWTQNQGMNPNNGEPYDWRCRLSVPGGGLVERAGSFDFEAPENGYVDMIELVQDRMDEFWRDSLAKQYFVRLPDNRYARVNAEMITNGDHFVVLESLLNPTPGDRNLEFDPVKVIIPKQ